MSKINKCITVTLNKCLNMDIKEIRNIIKDANLSSCRASNKAMRLWLKYKEECNDMYEDEKFYNKEIYEDAIDKEYNNQKCSEKKKKNRKYFEAKVYNKLKKDITEKYDEEFLLKYGKTLPNHIEGYMKDLMSDYNTGNVGALHQQLVQGAWNRNEKDILSYKSNISTFKEATPYFIRNTNYELSRNSKVRQKLREDKEKKNGNKEYVDGCKQEGYFVSLAFFSYQGLNKYGYKTGHKFEFQIDKMDGNKTATINKILNKEYKQGSCQIAITDKNKIELIISYSFEKEDEETLNYNRILGIDLGITNVLTMSIYDSESGKYDYVGYNHRVLKGKELISFRQKLFNMGMTNKEIENEVQKQNDRLHQSQLKKIEVGSINGLSLVKMRNTTDTLKKEMSSASKWCGEGRVGHGYKTKMKPVNKIRNKVSNFADTFNHKYSKYVVDFAVKNNCGVIQMEDLSGATANTREKFLKDWSYYDLQQKIIYKAREKGIKVGEYKNKFGKVTEGYMVNPRYTSKRCSKCGNIHTDNRDCKNNQAKFECVICGHKENADINASKNIAIPNIDKIIDTYLKETKLNKVG